MCIYVDVLGHLLTDILPVILIFNRIDRPNVKPVARLARPWHILSEPLESSVQQIRDKSASPNPGSPLVDTGPKLLLTPKASLYERTRVLRGCTEPRHGRGQMCSPVEVDQSDFGVAARYMVEIIVKFFEFFGFVLC